MVRRGLGPGARGSGSAATDAEGAAFAAGGSLAGGSFAVGVGAEGGSLPAGFAPALGAWRADVDEDAVPELGVPARDGRDGVAGPFDTASAGRAGLLGATGPGLTPAGAGVGCGETRAGDGVAGLLGTSGAARVGATGAGPLAAEA